MVSEYASSGNYKESRKRSWRKSRNYTAPISEESSAARGMSRWSISLELPEPSRSRLVSCWKESTKEASFKSQRNPAPFLLQGDTHSIQSVPNCQSLSSCPIRWFLCVFPPRRDRFPLPCREPRSERRVSGLTGLGPFPLTRNRSRFKAPFGALNFCRPSPLFPLLTCLRFI